MSELRTRFYAQGTVEYGGLGSIVEQVQLLDNNANSLASPGLNLSLRAGVGQTWQQFSTQQTLNAGSNFDFDLNNPSNTFKTGNGTPIEISQLCWFVAQLVNPDASHKVRVGPQGLSSAAQLWFGGVTSTYFEEVYDTVIRPFRPGLVITATTASKIRFNNPTADTITFNLWVAGNRAY